jgi:hypothetical protein
VILEKREPPLTRVATAADMPKIPGYAPFRDHETELLKLSMDLLGSPIRVLLLQASDQNPNLLGDLRSAAAWPRSPTPIETEPGAVPADHGLGLDDDQDVAQRDQQWRRAVQKSRSKEFNTGRGRFRFSTATCCRRARTSRAVSLRLRKKP